MLSPVVTGSPATDRLSRTPLSHFLVQDESLRTRCPAEPDGRRCLAIPVHPAGPDQLITTSFKPTKIIYGIALKSGRPITG